MSKDEQAIEAEIKAKGLNAPRQTPEMIDSVIAGAEYTVMGGVVTICALTLRNGFTVIGHSAPASAANFNAELGRQIAFNKAREQIWALEGYLLRQRIHQSEQEPLSHQRDTLLLAAETFDFYASQHDAKGTDESASKAISNRRMAALCREAAVPV